MTASESIVYTWLQSKTWQELSPEEQSIAVETLGSKDAYASLCQAEKLAQQMETAPLPPAGDDFLLIMAKVEAAKAPTQEKDKPPKAAWYAVPIPFYKAAAVAFLIALGMLLWKNPFNESKGTDNLSLAHLKDTIYQVVKVTDTLYLSSDDQDQGEAVIKEGHKPLKVSKTPSRKRRQSSPDSSTDLLALNQPDFKKDFNRGTRLSLDSSTGLFVRDEVISGEKLSRLGKDASKP